MASILDEPAVRRAVFPISVEFYHEAGRMGLLGKNVELLDGAIVTKMPKSPLHEWVVTFLFTLLNRALPVGLGVRKEGPLTLRDSEPEPDLSVVRGDPLAFRHGHPTTAEWVIEVAISSAEVDRRKASIYAMAEVKEYWIILPEERRVEVHRAPADGMYRERFEVTGSDPLESSVAPGLSIPLAQLFAP